MTDVTGRTPTIAHLGAVHGIILGTVPPIATAVGVTLCEHANFGGRTKVLGIGKHSLPDFNDLTSSVRVPQGLVALLFEHADSGGGYGVSVDLLEDTASLAPLNLAAKISYVEVFAAEPAEKPGFVWTRAAMVNGQFVPGHWERKRAQPPPPNRVPAVSPPLPPHGIVQPPVTGGGTPAVPGSNIVKNVEISKFDLFGFAQGLWDVAVNRQGGIIGSDYRGAEPIGSAAFQRSSKLLPDWLNFWYPNAQPRDARGDGAGHFKRTISGTIRSAHLSGVSTLESYFYTDSDVNIHVEPFSEYAYLVTDGHRREYTDIMSAQWNVSGHTKGLPDCDGADAVREAALVELEIDTAETAKRRLVAQLENQGGRQISAYGAWIYDKGHCCHNEIHPAEQIWWSDPAPAGRVYFCNLIVDGSERFWWRDQMDDGKKLKPWGAPPLTGTFAIAFEAQVNAPAKQFEIFIQEVDNAVTKHENFLRHHLVYGGTTLIAVVQDPASLLKISFEHVGLVPPNTVRGFIVLEATVGKCTQIATQVVITPARPGVPPTSLPFPQGSDVNAVPQQYERQLFRKEAGRLLMWVAQGLYRDT
jgi:hypothetical protein